MIVEVEKGELAVIKRKILLKDSLPHCKEHGAMIRVTPSFENNFSIWRCPICHIGGLYDNNIEDVHSAFFEGIDKKHNSEALERTFLELQTILSRNKINYRVLGLSSLYLQGFDVLPEKLSIELNKDDFKKVKQDLEKLDLLDLVLTDKKIERFEAETIDQIKKRMKTDKKLKSDLEKNSKLDKEIKKFFEL
ncbi:MAG: hypothetical protein PWP03_582 [Candidatus Woesearchaeota archaeon]|nr:hypothetical protein [Candidatus Woesearchaeota archaeon]MDN5327944.1 hypothetical protein [Candidatus Woesearchaeota archaeon]